MRNTDCATLLKLLDPYTTSAVSSRYRNKWLMADYIIITAPQSPEQWWTYHRDHGDEYAGAWEQLLRRLNGGSWHFLGDNKVEIQMYDGKGKKIGEPRLKYVPYKYNEWLKSRNNSELAASVPDFEKYLSDEDPDIEFMHLYSTNTNATVPDIRDDPDTYYLTPEDEYIWKSMNGEAINDGPDFNLFDINTYGIDVSLYNQNLEWTVQAMREDGIDPSNIIARHEMVSPQKGGES